MPSKHQCIGCPFSIGRCHSMLKVQLDRLDILELNQVSWYHSKSIIVIACRSLSLVPLVSPELPKGHNLASKGCWRPSKQTEIRHLGSCALSCCHRGSQQLPVMWLKGVYLIEPYTLSCLMGCCCCLPGCDLGWHDGSRCFEGSPRILPG